MLVGASLLQKICSVNFDYFLFFFFNDTATTEIYTLSLHDALPIGAGRRAPRAGNLQRKIVRLAAARKSFHHDALHRRAEASGAPGFAASRTRVVEAPPRFRAARGTRAPRPRLDASRLASRKRCFFGADSAILFRLPAWRTN